ncbi:MAG: HAD-IA family hydrolase [Alphaproteobacteria bacterium]
MSVSTVVFDFGGVLLDWDPDNLYRKLIPDNEDRATFLREVCAPSWNEEMDAGKSFAQGVAERQALFPQHADLIAAFFDRWPEMITGTIPGMVELHGRLRAHGVPMFGLTNFASDTMQIALPRWPVLGDFDGVIVSGDEGVIKPGREIYDLLLERYDLKAADCVFIDDRADNIATALDIGMQGIVFTEAQSCMDRLAELMPDLPQEVIYG